MQATSALEEYMSMIGKMLEHWQITSELEGGMGEACQVKDQKLGGGAAI